jgi:hypothetical protein
MLFLKRGLRQSLIYQNNPLSIIEKPNIATIKTHKSFQD